MQSDSVGQDSFGQHSVDQAGVETLSSLTKELRGLCSALPANIVSYLNEIQCAALISLEPFGWQIAFIRRALFSQPIIVMKRDRDNKFAVLEDDGSINLSPAISWRH